MTISLFGVVATVLLLIVPFYAFYALGIKFSGRLTAAVVRMLAGIVVAALLAKLSVVANNIIATIGICAIVIVAASLMSVARSRLRIDTYLLPTLGGMAAAVVVVSLFLFWMVITGDISVMPSLPVVVVAILAGGSVVPVSEALKAYYAGLRHHAQLFHYLIGNGASRDEALNYLLKRAVQRASIPAIRHIGGMMVASQPFMMWTMIAADMPITTAAAWEAVMAVALLATSVGAVMLSLMLARRFSVDGYSRIRC